MHVVLSEYEKQCDLIFIFGDRSVENFYPRFGFVPVQETRFYTSVSVEESTLFMARKLELSDAGDINILRRLVLERISLSSVFGVENSEGILAWHCLNVFPQNLYYIEALDAIIICIVHDHIVDLHDVIAGNRQDLQQILGALVPSGVFEVIFHFTPDFEGASVERKSYEPEDYIFFTRSDTVCLSGEFFFLATAHA